MNFRTSGNAGINKDACFFLLAVKLEGYPRSSLLPPSSHEVAFPEWANIRTWAELYWEIENRAWVHLWVSAFLCMAMPEAKFTTGQTTVAGRGLQKRTLKCNLGSERFIRGQHLWKEEEAGWGSSEAGLTKPQPIQQGSPEQVFPVRVQDSRWAFDPLPCSVIGYGLRRVWPWGRWPFALEAALEGTDNWRLSQLS